MKDFFRKIKEIEKEISKKRGEFELFAAFLREDAPDKWDIVVSASWLRKNDMTLLKEFSEIIKKHLDNDLTRLARIVILENDHPALKAMHSAINVKHGGAEVQNSNFFGLVIKHAYIITSKRPATSKKKTKK